MKLRFIALFSLLKPVQDTSEKFNKINEIKGETRYN